MGIIKSRHLQLDLPHPDIPSFIVTVTYHDKVDSLDFFSELQEHQTALAVRDPDNPEQYLRDDDGTIVVHVKQNYPPSAIFKMLKRHVKGWRGLTTDGPDGDVEIAFTPDNFHYLLADELDVTEKKTVETRNKVTGDTSRKEVDVKTPYWQWLSAKVRDRSLFDKDPKTSR